MKGPAYKHPESYYPAYRHPVAVGARVYYCAWPFEWGEGVFVEAVVTSAWFDNDWPVVNLRWRGLNGVRVTRGVKVDRVMVIDVIGKLAELDCDP